MRPNVLLELLQRVDPAALTRAIGPATLSKLSSLSEEQEPSLADADVPKYVMALLGTDVLNERSIRRLIFQLIDPGKLKELAERHSGRALDSPYDNALILASCSWKSGSGLVNEVAQLLHLPVDFLPAANPTELTIERISPAEPLHPLHAYQAEVRDALLDQLRRGTRAMLVQMPTGAGKTRTTVHAISDYACESEFFVQDRSVLWLAHTQELCEQAIDTFKAVWASLGSCTVQVARLWGTHKPEAIDLPGGFIVCTFQKLASLTSSSNATIQTLRHHSSVIITDEAHKVLAPTFRTAVNAVKSDNACLVGLTATPGRGTQAKENVELANVFGRNLISPNLGPNPISKLQEMGVLSHLVWRPIDTNVDIQLSDSHRTDTEAGLDLSDALLRRLANHKQRNRLIVNEIEHQVRLGNPCIVFSCGIEHSRVLTAALVLRGISAAHVDGGMRKEFRRLAIEAFRNGQNDVLINFGVLTTGFDAPRIRTVLITRPTTSLVLYSQMLGRGLRGPRMGGSAECTLIDLKDNFVNFGDVDAVYKYFDDYWTSD